jgi:PleD family two-component response regulator
MFFGVKNVRSTSRKILLVDDKSFHLMSLQDRLKKNYEVYTAQTVEEMFGILSANEIGLLMVDIAMADIDHREVIETLQTEVHDNEIPIVFMTSAKDKKVIGRGKQIGAIDCLLKPFSDSDLNDCIEEHLKHEKSVKPTILAIDDDPDILKSVNWLLERDYNVFTLPSPDKIKTILRKTTPDLFILDCNMSSCDGFELIPLIRKNPEHKETPIVCLTSAGTVEDISKAITLGANDFITKPIDGTLLKGKISAHLRGFLILRRIRKSVKKES